MISFSPPRIDEKIIEAVSEVLRSGWITTGPKTKLFERKIAEYCGVPSVLCLNSATAGLELALRWFGVGAGDEVILPAYTYSATANVVMHCGAKPVLADINKEDFNISIEAIKNKITERTKVIMPVDFGGLPCDYEAIMKLVLSEKGKFSAKGGNQQKLGRILVLADAAHSFGASYKGKKTGTCADISVFSFHEEEKTLLLLKAGPWVFNLPAPFDNTEIYKALCVTLLHGQNKDALAKTQKGNWKYDIVEPGYKCNMTDIMAVIGLTELERYDNDTLKRRKDIVEAYAKGLQNYKWAEIPVYKNSEKESSYHLFPLRIKGINEEQRDVIIQKIFNCDVSVNVHFIPLPMLSFYKSQGYKMNDYPIAYNNFAREISLPVFYSLTDEQVQIVLNAVIKSVSEVIG